MDGNAIIKCDLKSINTATDINIEPHERTPAYNQKCDEIQPLGGSTEWAVWKKMVVDFKCVADIIFRYLPGNSNLNAFPAERMQLSCKRNCFNAMLIIDLIR